MRHGSLVISAGIVLLLQQSTFFVCQCLFPLSACSSYTTCDECVPDTKVRLGNIWTQLLFFIIIYLFFTWSWNILTLYKRTISLITSRHAVLHTRRIWPAFTVRTFDVIYYSGPITSYHKNAVKRVVLKQWHIKLDCGTLQQLGTSNSVLNDVYFRRRVVFIVCRMIEECAVLTEP